MSPAFHALSYDTLIFPVARRLILQCAHQHPKISILTPSEKMGFSNVTFLTKSGDFENVRKTLILGNRSHVVTKIYKGLMERILSYIYQIPQKVPKISFFQISQVSTNIKFLHSFLAPTARSAELSPKTPTMIIISPALPVLPAEEAAEASAVISALAEHHPGHARI